MSSVVAKRLDGKTILVTGASSGIGRIDILKQVAVEIKREVGEGVRILPVQLDFSKPDEVFSFINKLPTEFKHINILINNDGLVKGVDKAPGIALRYQDHV
ncbi:NADP-dependent 3-hydroxy acid dehydrogenase [Lachnellula willkommii]|uniref:NADP-dependent 3-hydroxy acid dehydrogenase n=1 Tax=Lachnellula willkommii TaxID=215461 RepID=A0A559LZS3_9HELO|nr:NADP-dependent 3-hydroxy acid dehydrogenase [Lachnellula willkommii]